VTPNQWVEVDRPEILIVEGLKRVAKPAGLPKDGKAISLRVGFSSISRSISTPTKTC